MASKIQDGDSLDAKLEASKQETTDMADSGFGSET